MYIVQLDENRYFTGVYVSTSSGGGIATGGIRVKTLPPDMSGNRKTCWKYGSISQDVETEVPVEGEDTKVPVIDPNTGEQQLDEGGNPVFETIPGEITYETRIIPTTTVGWIFDNEKYDQLMEEIELKSLRQLREEAFITLDKMQLALYYNSLSDEQKQALTDYRQQWLDVTKTKQVPEMPECLQ